MPRIKTIKFKKIIDKEIVKAVKEDMRKHPLEYRAIFQAYRELPVSVRRKMRILPKIERKRLRKVS